ICTLCFPAKKELPAVAGIGDPVSLSFFGLGFRRKLHGKRGHGTSQSYIAKVFLSVQGDDGGPVGQSTERGKSCRYPAYTGVGFKTQTLQEQKKKSVQFKAETSMTLFYDLPVQILGRERNRAGQ